MFFFIGGLSPRMKRVYEPTKGMLEVLRRRPTSFCHRCNRVTEMDVFRQDYWFNFFFLPLARVKKGEDYIGCTECKAPMNEQQSIHSCRHCKGQMNSAMRYCPNCGFKS